MGAGRKTSTYDVDTGAQNEHARWRFESQQRLLREKLGGVIFGIVLIYIFTRNFMRVVQSYLRWHIPTVPQNLVADSSASCILAVCNSDTYEECVTGAAVKKVHLHAVHSSPCLRDKCIEPLHAVTAPDVMQAKSSDCPAPTGAMYRI